MECNRDEALRSKAIAEARFSQHDFVGAKKFAQKARQLFPELEGIPQLISALDIHILAEEKLQGGEMNWYAILQVEPWADENAIRKQYRKLALLLHPDKNKSVGAEAAFKHISEAWAILSDKAKKTAFDMKFKGKLLSRLVVSSHHNKESPTSATSSSSSSSNVSSSSAAMAAASGLGHSFHPAAYTDIAKARSHGVSMANADMAQARSYCANSANAYKAKAFKRAAPSPSSSPQPPPPPPPPPRRAPTGPRQFPSKPPFAFWTSCPSCKMELEYPRVYLNKTLCCPVCYKPFLGKEISPVGGTLLWSPQASSSGCLHPAHVRRTNAVPEIPSGVREIPRGRGQDDAREGPKPDILPGIKDEILLGRGPKSRKHPEVQGDKDKEPGEVADAGKDADNAKEVLRARFRKQGLEGSPEKAKIKKKNPSDVNPPLEELSSKHNEAKEAALAKQALDRLVGKPKLDIEVQLSSEKEKKVVDDKQIRIVIEDSGVACMNSSQTSRLNNNGSTDSQGHIISKGKVECSTMSRRKRASSERDGPMLEEGSPGKKVKEEDRTEDILARGEDELLKKMRHAHRNNESTSGYSHEEMPSIRSPMRTLVVDLDSIPIDAIPGDGDGDGDGDSYGGVDASMVVPDAEFYVFDKDRSEGHFAPDQVWAVYDDDDGMPRYYAKVLKVYPSKPFKLQLVWLEARQNHNKASACTGLSIACGSFKLGKLYVNDRINTYSHMMTFEKAPGPRGVIKIYPKKGEIWALYKEWDCLKARQKKPGYWVVEILTDFDDEEGCRVSKLLKVDGYKTLFCRKSGEAYVESILAMQLGRFSHRIPAYRLSGDEGPKAPNGCWELDPAATPPELISRI